jgi:hypothetical protein
MGFHGILGLPGRLEITRCTEAEVLAVPRPEHPEACETKGVRAEGAEDARSVARRRVRRKWGASTRRTFSDFFELCFAPSPGTQAPLVFLFYVRFRSLYSTEEVNVEDVEFL